MNALNSPLEVLAINYARFGFFDVLNNLWTWVGVLAETLGFWRIQAGAADARAASEASYCSVPNHPQPALHEDASSVGCPSVVDEKPIQWPDVSLVATASAHPLMTVSNGYEMTKRRFTVYYDDDWHSDDNQTEEDPVAVVGAEEVSGSEYRCGLEWWSRWERVLIVRNGDMGWCRYQDLAVFDGSVVRLWDDKRLQ